MRTVAECRDAHFRLCRPVGRPGRLSLRVPDRLQSFVHLHVHWFIWRRGGLEVRDGVEARQAASRVVVLRCGRILPAFVYRQTRRAVACTTGIPAHWTHIYARSCKGQHMVYKQKAQTLHVDMLQMIHARS